MEVLDDEGAADDRIRRLKCEGSFHIHDAHCLAVGRSQDRVVEIGAGTEAKLVEVPGPDVRRAGFRPASQRVERPAELVPGLSPQ